MKYRGKGGMSRLQNIGIGSMLGVSGIVFMSFGASLSNTTLLRVGIVLTTIGGWMITWN